MQTRVIRTRYFLAVEGEGEQSFIKWLQQLSDENFLNVHLDCQPLGGGGYKTMLERAIRYRKVKDRSKSKSSVLIVDTDRAERFDDGWSLPQLRQAASKKKIHVCAQHPNQEGLLVRMMQGNETLQLSATAVKTKLLRIWPDYEKPVDARTLAAKFSLNDLLRVAQIDVELKQLLTIIGLNTKS